MFDNPNHPHQGQPVLQKGANRDQAACAVILLHGRGASANSIMSLHQRVTAGANGFDEYVCWLAPQAAYHSWYPYTFLSPAEKNEPGLSSALNIISGLVSDLVSSGISQKNIVVSGFSQGACLSLEYAARNPGKYGGIVALSGGLIGDRVRRDIYSGSMEDTSVILRCGDMDEHIPLERVHASAGVFEDLHASVDKKIYPGLGHTVNEDEINRFRNLLEALK